ncbi:uncharacterized protein SOCE26_025990 [Sorangium cellulosum]|uniref:Uncharacterized protein n=1 Tax=Sorangium cellulosum TaxID=56 RepID=A0A2L0EPH0_SORCE|nr:hypothetical protein [Sorangium cellulosum]AUX41189.1 uncharacterized protein SOCE26_025990 [Sorangium cellulosum]
MTVRRLTEVDAAALRALRLRALREEPDPFLTTFDEEQARPLEQFCGSPSPMPSGGSWSFRS